MNSDLGATKPGLRISCVIPAYNSPFLLARCLASIVTQDALPCEIIVTDDSSDPAVKQLVDGWSGIYPYIRYLRGAGTGNAGDNWNHGLSHATGDYLVLVHHDDWFARKDFLSKAGERLSSASQGACLFAGSRVVGGLRASRQLAIIKIARRFGFPRWTLFGSNWMGAPSVFVFPNGTGTQYDRNLRSLIDVDFYARAMSGRELVELPGTFIYSGSHADQITANISVNREGFEEMDYLEKRGLPLSASQLRWIKMVLNVRDKISNLRPITPR